MRFSVIAASLAAVLSAPGAGLAEDAAHSRDALLTALAMNECSVAQDQTPALLGAQGFDPEYVRHELGQMVLDETAFLEGGYILRVEAPYCPPADPVPTPAQEFRQTIADNGCSIDEKEARALGIDTTWLQPVVQTWIESGEASIDWNTLTLEDCE